MIGCRESSPSVETIRLPYVAPYDWDAAVRFLDGRATAGVEWVRGGRYARTFCLNGRPGLVEVQHKIGESCLTAVVRAAGGQMEEVIPAIAERLRRMFDVETDTGPVETLLCRDPVLADIIGTHCGLRVPGGWDGFELAVRAILGQQVSVAAATTIAGRMVSAHGECVPQLRGEWADEGAGLRLFPRPEVLASADLTGLGLPRARAAAISSLAAAVAADSSLLCPAQDDVGAASDRLTTLPGIGPWTAKYIGMRWFRDADAFPVSDLGLRQSVIAGAGDALPTPAELARRAQAWRPWRAYAAMLLWSSLADRAEHDREGRRGGASAQTAHRMRP